MLFKVCFAPIASIEKSNSFEMFKISLEKFVHLDYDSIKVYFVYSSFFYNTR